MSSHSQRLFTAILLLLGYFGESQSQQFYPVDSGNLWSHRVLHNNLPLPWDSSIVQINVISDTILPNGQRYACLSHPDILGAKFVRADSAHVYYYSLQDGSDVAMFNLRSQPGEVDTINWYGLFTSRLNSVDTAQLLGEAVTLRSYAFDGIVQFKVTLADRYGIVYAEDWGDGGFPAISYWDLKGCIIRDTSHGVVASVPDDSRIPKEITLQQNYPNPFNPSTTITYSLPTSSPIRLSVASMLGQQVALLVDGLAVQGTHNVTFDASRHATGTYFVILSTPSATLIRKMILLK